VLALAERLFPAAVPFGTQAASVDEPVRLKHDPSLAFSSADISKVELLDAAAGRGPEVALTTTFLGLTGTVSPVPYYLAEEVLNEPSEHPTRRLFLDIFHHRILSLYYRAAVIADHPIQYRLGAKDAWSRRLLSLLGFVFDSPGETLPLPEWRLLRLAPLISQRFRGSDTIRRGVQDFLDLDVPGAKASIQPFRGVWVPLDPKQRIQLGQTNVSLGVDTRIGTRIFDQTGCFRISIRPVPFSLAERLRPGADLFKTLSTTVSLLLRDRVSWDVEITIAPDTTPTMHLSSKAGPKLGRETWLARRDQAEYKVLHQGT
jgi:type VI secretion system protein ImpH